MRQATARIHPDRRAYLDLLRRERHDLVQHFSGHDSVVPLSFDPVRERLRPTLLSTNRIGLTPGGNSNGPLNRQDGFDDRDAVALRCVPVMRKVEPVTEPAFSSVGTNRSSRPKLVNNLFVPWKNTWGRPSRVSPGTRESGVASLIAAHFHRALDGRRRQRT